ncbi:Spy/CpxP family protein refolding chaperone [Hydrogenophaga sp. 5NK40-0174]|uniref:Spy/CpxP family protein refolding chaperone n=1 Tax=Hydrogenophaga sp. 5NK40-0174 TaxID=3127649 RepID=UPI003104F474
MTSPSRSHTTTRSIFRRSVIALALAGVAAGTALAASMASPGASGTTSSIEPVLVAQHMAQRSWITAQNTAAADMMLARADSSRGGNGPGAAPMTQEQHQARMEERFKRHEARRTERLNALKTELKITAEQEAAWLAFVNRTAPDTAGMKERMAQREDWQKLTTPERIDRMQAMHAEHQATMNKHMDAIKSLYAALSPEQQKVFDDKGMRGIMGGKHMGMGHGKAGHHGHHKMHGEHHQRRHGHHHDGGRHHGKQGHHGDQCDGKARGNRMDPNSPAVPEAPEDQSPAKS